MPQLNVNGSGALGWYVTPEGVRCPRVTSILDVVKDKTWINQYIAKKGRREFDRKRNEGAELGTKVHKIAADIARARQRGARVATDLDEDLKLSHLSPEDAPFAEAIREFLGQHVEEVIAVEQTLSSARLGFGGTCDLYCRMKDGSLAVVDYKTDKSGVSKIHKLQTAAYALLLVDHGYTVNKRFVVRIHKDEGKRGKWYMREATEHEKDVRTFMACVVVWNWLHGSKLRQKS